MGIASYIINKVLPVQLTGSKVNQKKGVVILANAFVITDTTIRFYSGGTSWSAGVNAAIPNWNDYNRRTIEVLNSHDQPIDLGILSNLRGGWDYIHMGAALTQQKVTIPANGGFKPLVLSSKELEILDEILSGDASMLIAASVAPTTGSITIKLNMWVE